MIIKELFAKLGLTVDESGFVKAEVKLGAVKAALEVIGGVVVGAVSSLKDMVLHASEVADHLDETAQKAGISTDALQELSYAAGFSGLSTDDLAASLVKLTSQMDKAAQGGDEQAKAFARAGVTLKNADGTLRGSDEVLGDIAEKFESMPDGANKTALALELFGKSGAKMIPFLNAGKQGLADLRQEAQDFGLVMSESTIKEGAEFDDVLTRLKASVEGLQYMIGGSLLSVANEYGKALLEWVKANKDLIRQRIDKVVSALKVVLSAVLIPLKFMVTLLGIIIDNWKLIAVVLASVVAAALTTNAVAVFALGEAYLAAGLKGIWAGVRVAAAWIAANAPLIAMTLIFALIILLIDDVVVAMKGGKSVLKEWIQDWTDDPGENWFLRDMKALAYLLLNMGPIWDFWKGELQKLWDWMKEGFTNTWDDIVVGVKAMFGIEDDRNKVKAAEASHYAAGFISDMSSTFGPGEWKDDGFGGQLWYPFADVSEAALSSLNQTSSPSNSFVVNQSIMATPNQSASEVASEAVSQMEDWHQTVLTQAASEM